VQTLAFGSITVDAISDGELGLTMARMFPDLDVASARRLGGIDEQGNALVPLTTFVIRASGQVILVDTGIGPDLGSLAFLGAGRPVGLLPAALAAAGIEPSAVNAVVSTHLHADHVGWNVTDKAAGSRPLFPNARYIVTRVDWENRLTIAGEATAKRCLDPIQESGQLTLVEDGYRVVPGVELLGTPGHTPGHASVLVSDGGVGGVITGDAAHHPIEMEQPELVAAFDSDPAQSAASRKALVERVEAEGLIVMGGHFPPPTAGRVVRVEQKRRWQWLGV
jgi:glyoxylase-like metal-dependent hydrolase (beta-lactamase superfamily II)